jgi:hypothetical protein
MIFSGSVATQLILDSPERKIPHGGDATGARLLLLRSAARMADDPALVANMLDLIESIPGGLLTQSTATSLAFPSGPSWKTGQRTGASSCGDMELREYLAGIRGENRSRTFFPIFL